jgi:hypothetical protein
MIEVNGHARELPGDVDQLADQLADLQRALAKLAMGQPMDVQGCALSGYLNALMVSCRTDALAELLRGVIGESFESAFEAAQVKAFQGKVAAFQDNARKIQPASAVPSVIRRQ